MAIYSAVMLAMGLSYGALWLVITRRTGLLHAHLDPSAQRAAIRRFGLGNVAYLATVGLSFLSPVLTLGVHGAIAIYYCFDQLRIGGASSPQ
jgi:hypothetical protein